MREVILNLQEYEATLNDIKLLKSLCGKAADALKSNQFDKYSPVGVDLIAELRKAAE